jgi:hypothetical protein
VEKTNRLLLKFDPAATLRAATPQRFWSSRSMIGITGCLSLDIVGLLL